MYHSSAETKPPLGQSGARRAVRTVQLFLMGGFAYCGLEVAYRGYTHPTMALLGGICFLLLAGLSGTAYPLWLCALIGGAAISAAELLAGIVINLWLGLNVWDYSTLPFNLLGQICPQYTILWCALSGIAVYAARSFTKSRKRA